MVAFSKHDALDELLHAADLCCDPGLWQGRGTLFPTGKKLFLELATAIDWLALSFGYRQDVLFHKLIKKLDK